MPCAKRWPGGAISSPSATRRVHRGGLCARATWTPPTLISPARPGWSSTARWPGGQPIVARCTAQLNSTGASRSWRETLASQRNHSVRRARLPASRSRRPPVGTACGDSESAHPRWPTLRNRNVSSGLLLLFVFAVPYMTLNLWRLARGRSWAFTLCHVMKEWEGRERIEHAAARADLQLSGVAPRESNHERMPRAVGSVAQQ